MTNPPTIDYGRPEPKRKTSAAVWVLLVLGILCICLVLSLMVAGVFSISREREKPSQIKCASNLRQIGQAIYLYATENAGAFPPDFQTAITTQQLSAEVFTCPSSSDTRANAPSGLAQPGHCSYIYVGAGLNLPSNPNCIAALEDPANHGFDGADILYADGHVEWQTLPTVMQTLNDLAIGKNPPSTSTTFNQPGAKKDYDKNWKSRMPLLKSGVWPIPTTQPASP